MIRRTGKGQTLWHKGKERVVMSGPYINMIINRQPIIVNLQKKGKGYMESRYGGRECSWHGSCIIVKRGTIN